MNQMAKLEAHPPGSSDAERVSEEDSCGERVLDYVEKEA
jgi:hypothetical protein